MSLYDIGPGGTGPNFIRFTGLTGDAGGFHSIISERYYN